MNDLPAAAVEQHVLASLRVLGLYHATSLAERFDRLAHIEALARTLHALGHALDGRHGQAWSRLLQTARDRLSLSLERRDGSTTATFLYGQALATVLALRHGPADVRLAPPGLGLDLVTLAVAVEHLLVRGTDPRMPDAPELTFAPPSPREQVLLEVTRHLAALEAQDRLPPGHRADAQGLRETAGRLREVMHHPGEAVGPGAALVVRPWTTLTDDTLARHVGGPDPLDVLAAALLRSLVTPQDSPLVPRHDAALALSLERVADPLTPSEAVGA